LIFGVLTLPVSKGYGYGVSRHFQQYFSYIMVVSFIGGGNRSSRRKQTLSHNVVSSTPCHEQDFFNKNEQESKQIQSIPA
jgi:hypothetical protein